jgi:type I restriction enzyme, S subunit
VTVLPSSWVFISVGETGSWRGGGTPSKDVPEFWTNGDVPWVSPKDMKTELIRDSEDHITDSAIEQSATSRVPVGSVLVVTRSGILARTLPVAVTAAEVTINQDLKAVTPGKWVEANFVAWALRAFASDILERCKKDGTTVASIDSEALRRYQVPLAPQNEQRRVVEAIDSYLTRLNHAVANLERAQAKLSAYRASVLRAAVEGRLVPTEASLARADKRDYEPAEALLARILKERRRRWEETELARLVGSGKTPKDEKWKANYEEPVAPDTRQLPELPEGWCWVSLDQLLAEPLANGKSVADGNGVPVLRLTSIKRGLVDLTERKSGDWNDIDPRRFLVKADDFLIIRGNGSIHQVGRGGRVSAAPDGVAYPDTLIRARADPSVLHPPLLARWWDSPPVRQHIERRAKTTAGIYKVNQTDLGQTPVPLAPMLEQTRIYDELERVDTTALAAMSTIDADVRRCSRLRQAVLKWAFEGKLVDQDPTDEPAEKLLTQIRAERAADAAVKKDAGRRANGAA